MVRQQGRSIFIATLEGVRILFPIVAVLFVSACGQGTSYSESEFRSLAASSNPFEGQLRLIGPESLRLEVFSSYEEPGFEAVALGEGDVSRRVRVSSDLNLSQLGEYLIIYQLSAPDGSLSDQKSRRVQVVDTTAPQIQITNDTITVNEETPAPTPDFTVTDNYDSNAELIITSNVNMEIPGNYQMSAVATDSSGNTSQAASVTVHVLDITAPNLVISTFAPSQINSSNQNQPILLSGNCTDADGQSMQGASIRLLVDGNSLVPEQGCQDGNFDFSLNSNLFEEGSTSIEIKLTDLSGNPSSEFRTLTKDTAGPSISITAPFDIQINAQSSGQVQFAGSCEVENNSSFSLLYRLANSGSPYTSVDLDPITIGNFNCSPSGSFLETVELNEVGGIGQGVYDIAIRYTDQAGNFSDSNSVSLTKDTEAPVITLNDGDLELRVCDVFVEPGFTVSDNLSSLESDDVQVTGEVNTLEQGIYSITYSVSDDLGNSSSVIRNVAVDFLVPASEDATEYQYGVRDLSSFNRMHTLPDGKFILCGDLSFEDQTLTPIASFSGAFNGQGYALSDFRIEANQDAGLFSVLEPGALVRELRLINASLQDGGDLENIENLGILAGTNHATIRFVELRDSSIDSMRVASTVGALVGENSVTGAMLEIQIVNTVITAPHINRLGGVVGDNHGLVSYVSFRGGRVIGSEQVGGAVGLNSSVVKFSYSEGVSIEAMNQVGGLIGRNDEIPGSPNVILGSYAASPLSVSETQNPLIHGLIGVNNNPSGAVIASYFDTDILGFVPEPNISAYGQGLTTSQMQQSSSYDPEFGGFGEDEVWSLLEGDYPRHRWVP